MQQLSKSSYWRKHSILDIWSPYLYIFSVVSNTLDTNPFVTISITMDILTCPISITANRSMDKNSPNYTKNLKAIFYRKTEIYNIFVRRHSLHGSVYAALHDKMSYQNDSKEIDTRFVFAFHTMPRTLCGTPVRASSAWKHQSIAPCLRPIVCMYSDDRLC